MEEDYSVLVALQENFSDTYSEDNLKKLEHYVTRYKEILEHISNTADPENITMYSQERVNAIEAALRDAKYGHSESQREAAYLQAIVITNEGISALLYHLNHSQNE